MESGGYQWRLNDTFTTEFAADMQIELEFNGELSVGTDQNRRLECGFDVVIEWEQFTGWSSLW